MAILTAQQETIREFQEPRQVTRFDPGSTQTVDGFVSRGTPDQIEIQAAVMPLTTREIRNLPEGEDARNWRLLLTFDPLGIELNDEVKIGTIRYSVQRVEDWSERQDGEAEFLKAEMKRIEGTPL